MIEKKVKELIAYAKSHLDLDGEDEIYFENIILGELKLSHPYKGSVDEVEIKELTVPDTILSGIENYVIKHLGYAKGEASRFVTKLMGLLTPKPSEVNRKFRELAKEDSRLALDYLYNLSIYNNYIAKTAVEKNILWEAKFPNNVIEISINLSKPEKNNKDIKKLLTVNTTDKYPECLLCKENQGFYGTDSHPARQNIRIIPINLAGEDFFLQYSPYVYYDHHCIVLHKDHFNMKIDKKCINELCDFVDLFPSFFVGSNADLPIVGGSILNHEHFQGGKHILPMLKAPVAEEFGKRNGVKMVKLAWYNTCLRLESDSKVSIIEEAGRIIELWHNYSDEANDIICHTTEDHNTITPILRKKDNTYYCYLILRNNRTSEEYPDGIFHAHPEYHMIKKEGIGLIEAMGLFILPARLERQFQEIMDIYGQDDASIVAKYPDLQDFLPMIHALPSGDLESIRAYVNNVCMHILENVAVFKNDEKGINGLRAFMNEVLKDE